MILVHSAPNLIEIVHLHNLLQASAIPSIVRNQHLATLAGEVPFTECAPQLWVLEASHAEQARHIIRQARRAPVGPPWLCAACGETHEAQFNQCWQCGAERAL